VIAPATREVLLQVEDLTLRFGGVVALSDVAFEVRRGEMFAVIGPNGAGKSSLFNCLTGLFRPAAGSIRLAGQQLVGRTPHAIAGLGVARTFQNLGLFDSMNVIDNLMVGRHLRMQGGVLAGASWFGLRGSERAARLRCHEIVDLLDLHEIRYTEAGQLPYGLRKRVELGKALALDPALLLLDEPVAGMNPEETEHLIGYVHAIQEELDLTIILIEHDMHLVMDVADRVMAIDFGQVIGMGLPEEVQRNPRVVEAYLGVGPTAAAPGPPGTSPVPDAPLAAGAPPVATTEIRP
jgi:branched-chain amino acid transport system ATP-binding protein